jgi:hypothetical protein
MSKLFIHGFGSTNCTTEFGKYLKKEDFQFNWQPHDLVENTLPSKQFSDNITEIVSMSFGAVVATLFIQKYNLKIKHSAYAPVLSFNQIIKLFFENGSPVDLVTREKLIKNNQSYYVFGESWQNGNFKVSEDFYDSLKKLEDYKVKADKIYIAQKDEILPDNYHPDGIIIDNATHDFETFK